MAATTQTAADTKPFITVTSGMSGHFAVLYAWAPEGHWDVYDTGYGRYATKAEAINEAKQWAEDEGLEFKE